MSIEFDASELRTLAADLGNVPKLAGQLAKVAVKKTAKDIEATAKALAPVDTGFLRSAVKSSDLRNVSQDSPEAEVRAGASYSVYQELGTSRMAPQPFMGPAADKHTPAFEAAMAEIAAKALGG
ncbi:HK97-gp10 family putative phage morphogenesis protein [Glutamicibacter creatinolyticus]|uniref:HK97-gp10 family putative phage morphogenesis protein n=1 Tax=Glutamicibacter creatinolyticus TaxID=162496 RepID=UPI0031DEEDDE